MYVYVPALALVPQRVCDDGEVCVCVCVCMSGIFRMSEATAHDTQGL